MEQPQGFVSKGQENKVCLLKKSLYGLKQAPRSWNIKLNETLISIGFIRTPSEPCVYTKKFGNETVILACFVDDIIVFYKDVCHFDSVKSDLESHFELKNLGLLKYYLGMNISVENGEVCLSQRSYIENLLKRYNLHDCKPVDIPMVKKLEDSTELCDQNEYQTLIGCLLFVAINTRPDISFAVSYLSQWNSKPTKVHWLAAKRILRYLKGTIHFAIRYKKTGSYLLGSVDADWANDIKDRRSYTGFLFLFGGGPISWESKKQPVVALSSTEAEYIALCSASKEAVFLRRFLFEVSGLLDIVVLSGDSQSAQNIALNPIHHGRTKHIDTKYHFIREKISDNTIKLNFMPTTHLLADVFTKPLQKVKFKRCLSSLGFLD